MIRFVFSVLFISLLLTKNAYAYVGPGLGLGVIGAIIGVVVAVILSIVGVVWYPLKRLLIKMKRKKPDVVDTHHDTKGSE